MPSTLVRFLKYTRPYRWLIAGAIVCGVFKFTLALFLPGTFGYVIDHVLLTELGPDEKLARLLTVLGVLLAVLLLRMPMTYLRSYWCEMASMRTIFDIRAELFRHIQRLREEAHDFILEQFVGAMPTKCGRLARVGIYECKVSTILRHHWDITGHHCITLHGSTSYCKL